MNSCTPWVIKWSLGNISSPNAIGKYQTNLQRCNSRPQEGSPYMQM